MCSGTYLAICILLRTYAQHDEGNTTMPTIGFYMWLTKPGMRQGNRTAMRNASLILSGMSGERIFLLLNS